MGAKFNREDVSLGAIPCGRYPTEATSTPAPTGLPNRDLDWGVLPSGLTGQVLTVNAGGSIGWSPTGASGITAGPITATSAVDQVQMVVQANSTQTRHLEDWRNSADSPLAYIDAAGGLTCNNIVTGVGASSMGGSAVAGTLLTVNTSAAGAKGLVVQGASAQTANLQEWQASGGARVAFVDSAGNLGSASVVVGANASSFGGAAVAGTLLTVNTSSASAKGLVVLGAGSQTANLQEWQASGGSVLTVVRPDGSIGLPSLTDSAAVNGSLYFSSTTTKVTYKDSSGNLHVTS